MGRRHSFLPRKMWDVRLNYMYEEYKGRRR